jgi:hypothetical protein
MLCGLFAVDDRFVFDVYFGGIVSMSMMHPGAGSKDHKKPTLEQCADTAVEMINIRKELISKGVI